MYLFFVIKRFGISEEKSLEEVAEGLYADLKFIESIGARKRNRIERNLRNLGRENVLDNDTDLVLAMNGLQHFISICNQKYPPEDWADFYVFLYELLRDKGLLENAEKKKIINCISQLGFIFSDSFNYYRHGYKERITDIINNYEREGRSDISQILKTLEGGERQERNVSPSTYYRRRIEILREEILRERED